VKVASTMANSAVIGTTTLCIQHRGKFLIQHAPEGCRSCMRGLPLTAVEVWGCHSEKFFLKITYDIVNWITCKQSRPLVQHSNAVVNTVRLYVGSTLKLMAAKCSLLQDCGN